MDVKTTRLKGWLHSLKIFPHSLGTKWKQRKASLQCQNLVHVNQVINDFVTNNETKWRQSDAERKTQCHFCGIPIRYSWHESDLDKIIRHFQTERDIFLNIWPVFSKNKDSRKIKKLFEMEEDLKDIMWKWNWKLKWSDSVVSYPMDSSLPGSSIHGIFQSRILKWVAISFSRRSSWPWDWTQVFHIVGKCFTNWAIREVKRHKK